MAESPQQTLPELDFPVQFGRYTLLKRLGEGGMGEIFLASLQGGIAGVEKICVIKKLRRMFSHDDEFVTRFLDEARLMVQLNHANIVPVFDAGTIDGDYFLAMELVDGMDLREVMLAAARRGETLSQPLALFVIREILGALAYAHKKADAQGRHLGLVHRDISPQNVLISVNGEVKLIDFGLAKSTQKVLKTDPRVVLGKYAYMSPEQARGQPVDGRSDLFAVGLLLFELVANRKLWDGVTVGELMEQIAEHRVFPPGRVTRGVDPEVDALVERALLKDANKRFQTAEEFRDAVSRVLSRMAPTISPDTLGGEVRRARSEAEGAQPEPPRLSAAQANEPTAELDAEPPPVDTADADPTMEEELPAAMRQPRTQVVRKRRPTVDVEIDAENNGRAPSTVKLVAMGLGIGAAVVIAGVLAVRAIRAPSPPPGTAAAVTAKDPAPAGGPTPPPDGEAPPPTTNKAPADEPTQAVETGKPAEVKKASKPVKKKRKSRPKPRKRTRRKK